MGGRRTERAIDTMLTALGADAGPADFSAVADRLVAAGADRIETMKTAGARIGRDLGAVLDSLDQLRGPGIESEELLDRGGRALCAAGIFDRVLVSQISGSTWLPRTLYVRGDDGRVFSEIDSTGALFADLLITLASPLVEAEVVRRRLPALVGDAQHESRVHPELLARTGATEYVTAPVVVGDAVCALVHADNAISGRTLTTADRDLLRMFGDGVGLIAEQADLAQREESQHRAIAEARGALGRVSDGPAPRAVHGLRVGAAPEPAVPVAAQVPAGREQSGRLARLTAREREVLALLSSGATNAQLADRLTVAESTVKSHVKHILHKLGAGNRAAAIACYLRESRDNERRLR